MSFQTSHYKNNNNQPTLPYNKLERLGEFLGFLPDQLANDLYNTYNVVVYTTLESLESYLKTLDGLSEIQIKERLQRFDEKVEQILDKNFSGFEKYFYDNIFGVVIEGHIPLEHYEGLDLNVTEEQEDIVDRALEKSRRIVLAQKAMNHMLKNKMNQMNRDNKALNSYFEITQAFVSLWENEQVSNPYDITQFAVDRCEHLRQSVYELLRLSNDNDLMKKMTTPSKRIKYMMDDVQKKLEEHRNKMELC